MTTQEKYEYAKRELEIAENYVAGIDAPTTILEMLLETAFDGDVVELVVKQRERVLALGDQVLAELRAQINELEAKEGGE
ncbi:MAG: hypothetical protein EBZ48_13365 [Proteobacteria bacterium]|nr:hypothetical protein [Pseudomonadota bacterium]